MKGKVSFVFSLIDHASSSNSPRHDRESNVSDSSPKTGSSPTSSTKRSADEGNTTNSNTSGIHSNEDSSGSANEEHTSANISPRGKMRRHDLSHIDILERVFPMQKRSVLMAALTACHGDLAKTIDHFITLGDNMVSIQHQLQSEVTPQISSTPANMPMGTSTSQINGKSAFTPITTPTHLNGHSFDFRPTMFFATPNGNGVQRENHLPLLPPPPPPPNHHFPGLYPPPVNFLHHFAQTHPAALAAAYEKLLKRHQQETAAAVAAASLSHKNGGDR